jgi:hypothetical protein
LEEIRQRLRAFLKLRDREEPLTWKDLLDYIEFLHNRGHREFIEVHAYVAADASEDEIVVTASKRQGERAKNEERFQRVLRGDTLSDEEKESLKAAMAKEKIDIATIDPHFYGYAEKWSGIAINTPDSDDVFRTWNSKPGRKAKGGGSGTEDGVAPHFRYLKTVMQIDVAPGTLSSECSKMRTRTK